MFVIAFSEMCMQGQKFFIFLSVDIYFSDPKYVDSVVILNHKCAASLICYPYSGERVKLEEEEEEKNYMNDNKKLAIQFRNNHINIIAFIIIRNEQVLLWVSLLNCSRTSSRLWRKTI